MEIKVNGNKIEVIGDPNICVYAVKPCPFCGAEAKVCVRSESDGYNFYLSAECSVCNANIDGASGSLKDRLTDYTQEEIHQVITAWNRRTQN